MQNKNYCLQAVYLCTPDHTCHMEQWKWPEAKYLQTLQCCSEALTLMQKSAKMSLQSQLFQGVTVQFSVGANVRCGHHTPNNQVFYNITTEVELWPFKYKMSSLSFNLQNLVLTDTWISESWLKKERGGGGYNESQKKKSCHFHLLFVITLIQACSL